MNRWQLESSWDKEIILKTNQEFFVKTSDLIKSLRKKVNSQSIKLKKLQKENEELKEELKEFDKYITKYIRKLEVLYYKPVEDKIDMPYEIIYEDEDMPVEPIEVIYEDEDKIIIPSPSNKD